MTEKFDKSKPKNETPSEYTERLARIAYRAWYGITDEEVDAWHDYGLPSKQRWYDVASSLQKAMAMDDQ